MRLDHLLSKEHTALTGVLAPFGGGWLVGCGLGRRRSCGAGFAHGWNADVRLCCSRLVVGVVGESMHCWVLREHALFGVVLGGEMVLVFTSVLFGVVPGLGVGGPVVGLFSCVV